jgi:hypothetical protein
MTLPVGQLMNFVEPRQLFRSVSNLPMEEIEGIVTSVPVDPGMVYDGVNNLRDRRRRHKQEQNQNESLVLEPPLKQDTFTPSGSTWTQGNTV